MGANWTPYENALFIRGAVQAVQYLIGFPVRDGKCSAKALHEAFRAALVDAGLDDQAARPDDRGPTADLLFSSSELSEANAEAFRVAWAWWVKLRGRPPYPAAVEATIAGMDAALTADGDAPLTARDAEEFVGDVPRRSGGTRALCVLLGVGLAIGAAATGAYYGRRRCVLASPLEMNSV